MSQIFSGVKVIDLTKVFSGPFATRMLADYGAEVIKVENDTNYDDSRNFPPLKRGWSGYYEILNRNKKGVSLNLKDETDLHKFYTLCKDADVLIENLTPSTKHRLRVDYETVKEINPKIIYASLSGLGQSVDKKYYDVIAQAQSGMISLSGTPDTPMKIGPSVVDAFSGMTMAFAISSALFFRERTGQGQFIDVAMLPCAMNLLESNLIDYSINQQLPQRTGNLDNTVSPFGAYKSSDGYIVIAVGNNSLWDTLLKFLNEHIGVDDTLFGSNELRLQNNQQLTHIIETVFSRYSVKELEQKLTAINIPCSRVYTMADVISEDPNFQNGSLIKINHPLLGECVIPGRCINFSEDAEKDLAFAPAIGQDNNRYGI